ncbi:MAG: hypothetical protein ACNA8O_07690 [Cyanobacteriota bacterium]
MVRLLRLESAPLITAQSNSEVEAVMRQANSLVVQTADGQRSVEFAAFLQLCSASPWARGSTGWCPTIAAVLGSCSMRYAPNRSRSAGACSRQQRPRRFC